MMRLTPAIRNLSHSPCYDHAHEGKWKLLLSRCGTHSNECNYVDKFHNTPLHLACRRQPPRDVVAALIRANPASLQVTTLDGMTPLHFACYCGAGSEVISTLVDHYPEATLLRDNKGRTPLHLAAAGFRSSDRYRVVRSLLDANSCVVNWEDGRGRTPLTLLFEDYVEEIEEGDVRAFVMGIMKKNLALRRDAPHASSNLKDMWRDDTTKQFNEMMAQGYDPEEIKECWESIVLLVKASYYHFQTDAFVSVSVGDDEEDATGPGNSFSSGGSIDAEHHFGGSTNSTHSLSGNSSDESSDHGAFDGRSPSCVAGGGGSGHAHDHHRHHKEFLADRDWNIVHAVVGIPRIPSEFVKMVLELYPDEISQVDGDGNLPLHVAARAPTISQHRRQQMRKDEEARLLAMQTAGGQKRSAPHRSQTSYPAALISSSKTDDNDDYITGSSNYLRSLSSTTDLDGDEESGSTAPSIVVQNLLAAYPAGAVTRDGEGKLPLHIAIEHGKSWTKGGVADLLQALILQSDSSDSVSVSSSGSSGRSRRGRGKITGEEEEMQRSIIRALCCYGPSPLSDVSPSSSMAATSDSGVGGVVEEDEATAALITPSDVQREASKTLSRLLPYWSDTVMFAEELLSRSLVSNYGANKGGGGGGGTGDHGSSSRVHYQQAAIATKASMLEALGVVLRSYGVSVGEHAADDILCDDTTSIVACALELGKKMLFHPIQCIRTSAGSVLGAACDKLGLDTTLDVIREVILRSSSEQVQLRHQSLSDGSCSSMESNGSSIRNVLGGGGGKDGSLSSSSLLVPLDHGKACVIYHIFLSPVGCQMPEMTFRDIIALVKELMHHKHSASVREAACLACGAILGSDKASPAATARELKGAILRLVKKANDECDAVHIALARGLRIPARKNRHVFMCRPGVAIEDGALMMAIAAESALVKRAYNEFLWLALGVGDPGGGVEGLKFYMENTRGENGKIMMTLVTKVLHHMDGVISDDEHE